MIRHPRRSEIIEEFTFRQDEREYIVADAVIDTGAQNTYITQAIVDAIGLQPVRRQEVSFASGAGAPAEVYRCIVAWTIYEHQGFHSLQEVYCVPGDTEVLIGFDFLAKHELTVDMHHHGLVGTASGNAVPLTGGGWAFNAPRSWISARNRERVAASKSGEVLRPHPAWRFTVPAIVKA
jgi:predicted aspartyl protease